MIGKTMALSAALAAGAALGAPASADARIAKQLDRLGLEYTTTSSGNYSIVYNLDADRKQTVYVMSKTETYGGLEIREIWSNAGEFQGDPSVSDLTQLLQSNGTEKIGAWSLEDADDGAQLAYFSIKVPTYLKDKDFADMLEFTAQVGDEMEAKLFDTDEN